MSTELTHSWMDSDKESEMEITVKVDNDGVVEEVVDLVVWQHEDGRHRTIKAILNLEMCEAAGIIDPMLKQVDWHEKLADHLAAEAEYNELSRMEE